MAADLDPDRIGDLPIISQALAHDLGIVVVRCEEEVDKVSPVRRGGYPSHRGRLREARQGPGSGPSRRWPRSAQARHMHLSRRSRAGWKTRACPCSSEPVQRHQRYQIPNPRLHVAKNCQIIGRIVTNPFLARLLTWSGKGCGLGAIYSKLAFDEVWTLDAHLRKVSPGGMLHGYQSLQSWRLDHPGATGWTGRLL